MQKLATAGCLAQIPSYIHFRGWGPAGQRNNINAVMLGCLSPVFGFFGPDGWLQLFHFSNLKARGILGFLGFLGCLGFLGFLGFLGLVGGFGFFISLI